MQEFQCIHCRSEFVNRRALKVHWRKCAYLRADHLPDFTGELQNGAVRQFLCDSALQGSIQNVRLEALSDNLTFEEFRSHSESMIEEVARRLMEDDHDAHVGAVLSVRYEKTRTDDQGEELHERIVAFHYFDNYLHGEFDVEQMFSGLNSQIDTFTKNGSGWTLGCVLRLDLNLTARFSINHIC